MAKDKAKTIGGELEDQLLQAIHAADHAPLPGARDLPIVTGLDRSGGFTEPPENVILRAVEFLVGSGRVYIYGDTVVMEAGRLDGGGMRLVPLRAGEKVETGAKDWIANLFVCQHKTVEFTSRALLDVVLRSEHLLSSLPRINLYATRPVFDNNFILCGPGWDPDAGILVHGPEIDPPEWIPGDLDVPVMERLPQHLRTLLRGFCFRADADVANAVSLLLTGLLVNHFVTTGKPVGLIDGNQPGLGKTLLIRVIGIILDGIDPRLIHYTADDEELQKRILATLRPGQQSVLLIDNAKVMSGSVVTSPAIEANSMAPTITLRILKTSWNYSRPNDVLWFLTMNDTRTSPDLVSRGLPVQLAYEGDPKTRVFEGPDPIDYAHEHRLDILGELAGMVIQWNQQGRPPGQQQHRCHQWARVVGGILNTAGLPEFLSNAASAAATFDTALDELAALIEAMVEGNGPVVIDGESDDEED